ncbi:hypothetical protein MH215_28280 [Paenibacillus sp. ACRSA]|uniref:hypothetical protein n=1 Tax=Paenibacillus sp. ACRSA TaxID=2918211 RepID=UPI001EF56E4B|nr:hypothetical protein [Paenibacillus sp. ACRSA]MCG7380886.1 hypothetical protein [Paenibacillus sp. ACRSA]
MGTKFANLHIKTEDQTIIIEGLNQLNNQLGNKLTGYTNDKRNIIDQYLQRIEKEEPNREKHLEVTYYIDHERQWTTILNDYFEWGTIEQVGELLSKCISEPIMTIGFFDEDIFEFTLFQNGKIKFKKYFCGEWASEEYDLNEEVMDVKYLKEVLEIDQESIDKLLQVENPEEAVDELAQLIHIHLWVSSNWIPEDEELKKKYSKLDLKIM